MSFFHGLGMFIFGMSCTLIGAIIAFYIIKKLEAELREANAWKEDEVEKFRNRLRDSAPYEKRLGND